VHTPTLLTGDELFHAKGKTHSVPLLAFWRWMASDLLSNATRGRLAEYLVAWDLGVADGVRREWVSHDLTTKDGLKVEVKSAAYVQGWTQRRPSPISFDIAPTLGWDPDTALFGNDRRRQADVYVFCLLHEQDAGKVDPMDVSHWSFLVVSTATLNRTCTNQKSIGLRSLRSLQPLEVGFGGILEAVTRAARA